MIMLIIMFSAMIGYAIALERVPQNAAEAIVGITSNREALLAARHRHVPARPPDATPPRPRGLGRAAASS